MTALKVPPVPAGTADALALAQPREVVVVTGISGSGKSVALHALEDSGYSCVDNLPPELLPAFLTLERQQRERHVAIAVDARSAGAIPQLVPVIERLRENGVLIRLVFLDASTDTLVRRFSETRRPHPLSQANDASPEADPVAGTAPIHDGHRALIDAIDLERALLADVRELSTVIDTSQLRPAQLRTWVRELVQASGQQLTMVFQSFAFKHGVPLDADYVFDVRVLPNPHYVRELRALTGRDAPVAAYLAQQPEVQEMLEQIRDFLLRWLPAFEADQRSYLTVAIGCTGGQHRSVYFVEQLAVHFSDRAAALIRHRELTER